MKCCWMDCEYAEVLEIFSRIVYSREKAVVEKTICKPIIIRKGYLLCH